MLSDQIFCFLFPNRRVQTHSYRSLLSTVSEMGGRMFWGVFRSDAVVPPESRIDGDLCVFVSVNSFSVYDLLRRVPLKRSLSAVARTDVFMHSVP